MACGDWGSDITAEGFTIGEENPLYTGGAFDNDIADANATGSWYAWDAGYKNTGWTGQDFGAANSKIVGKYRVCSVNVADRTWDPKDWTFEGSNTGAWGGEETVLDTVTGESFTQQEWKDYTFDNSTSYRYYRIDVTANNGDGTYLVVQEMEMFECLDSSSSSSESSSSSSESSSSSSSSESSSSSSESSSSSSESSSSSSSSESSSSSSESSSSSSSSESSSSSSSSESSSSSSSSESSSSSSESSSSSSESSSSSSESSSSSSSSESSSSSSESSSSSSSSESSSSSSESSSSSSLHCDCIVDATGAGTAVVNDEYDDTGTYNAKTMYIGCAGNVRLWWDLAKWIFSPGTGDGEGSWYYYDDGGTDPWDGVWSVGTAGSANAPTVTEC